jgi:cytochrome P450
MPQSTQSRGAAPPARAGVLDVLSLGATIGADLLRGPRSDPAAAGQRWADRVMARDGGADIDLPVLPIELVGNREHSNEILDSSPITGAFRAGHTRTQAMSFLAPGALTIAHGDAWRRLRPFNEQVLGSGRQHPFARTFLSRIRTAFVEPVRDEKDIRDAMGEAMVSIVLGDVSPQLDPAGDVTKLFDVVQSPLKRKVLGFLYRARRERLYELISRKWDYLAKAPANEREATLLAIAAHAAPDVDRATLLQQVPHWMFTFTGSGTALLTRALCLVSSRPNALALVLDEVRACGPIDDPAKIDQLTFLNACLLEAGRLFPPVTKTFHERIASSASASAKPGREYAHYFPLLQRDDRLGPTVHEFRPERWLEPTLDAPAAASNLFLRGDRACPGMDLILFVCKTAIVRQLAELEVSAVQERLAHDPLPVSFPKVSRRFTTPR